MLKKVLLLITLALALTSAAACSTTTSSDYSKTAIIDVRTAEEYAAGHLEGAVNIDVESPTFQAVIESLPTEEAYAVYCRTGRRSAVAKEKMDASGFTAVADLGSLEDAASSTGRKVVTS